MEFDEGPCYWAFGPGIGLEEQGAMQLRNRGLSSWGMVVDKEACRGPKVVDRGGVEWGGCATGLSQVSTGVDARHGGVAKMDRLWLLLKDCWAEGPVRGPPMSRLELENRGLSSSKGRRQGGFSKNECW